MSTVYLNMFQGIERLSLNVFADIGGTGDNEERGKLSQSGPSLCDNLMPSHTDHNMTHLQNIDYNLRGTVTVPNCYLYQETWPKLCVEQSSNKLYVEQSSNKFHYVAQVCNISPEVYITHYKILNILIIKYLTH